MSEQHLGVVIIVKNSQGQILLGQRKNSFKASFFGVPGGRVEVGEKLDATAIRELKEETNLEPSQLVYKGFIKELQEGFDFIHFVFVTTEWSGEPECMEPEKCAGWEWYDVDALPPMMVEGHRAALTLIDGPLPFMEI